MSEFEAECPACGHHLRLPASFAGKAGKCPRCRQTIQLPDAPVAAAQVAAPIGTPVEPAGAPEPAPERPCPFCGERIKVAARKCRHCGEFLDPSARRREVGVARPPAPLVLRIWGIGLMALNGLMLAFQLLQLGVVIFAVGARGAGGGAGLAAGMGVAALIAFVIYGVLIRLGWGLYRGQRSAVIGMCVLAALGLGVVLLIATQGGAVEAGVVLGFLGLIYAPPIGVGIARWQDLT